jgi:hypothetical protein
MRAIQYRALPCSFHHFGTMDAPLSRGMTVFDVEPVCVTPPDAYTPASSPT